MKDDTKIIDGTTAFGKSACVHAKTTYPRDMKPIVPLLKGAEKKDEFLNLVGTFVKENQLDFWHDTGGIHVGELIFIRIGQSADTEDFFNDLCRLLNKKPQMKDDRKIVEWPPKVKQA